MLVGALYISTLSFTTCYVDGKACTFDLQDKLLLFLGETMGPTKLCCTFLTDDGEVIQVPGIDGDSLSFVKAPGSFSGATKP